MSINLFSDDLSALKNDELYTGIKEFAKAQPSEGWRHDYTLIWSDSALTKVAAFSNTFGGILIVGVKKEPADTVCELLGVESETEYKTRIASSIGANVSPVPSYDVFECYKPDDHMLKFCVVRIRQSKSLHLITKKGISPAYVRNEDESRPADAAQLRSLIDREREAPTIATRLADRIKSLRDVMAVNCGYQNKDSEMWFMSPRHSSETSLKCEMILADTVVLELDESHEERLSQLVAEFYPRICETVQRDVAKQCDGRHADFYEYVAYHKKLDFETRWRIAATGDLGHATQITFRSEGIQNVWSIVDLAVSLILFQRMSMKWWESIGYFGGGYLHAHLMVDALNVLREPKHGYYIHAFDPSYTPSSRGMRLDIRKDAILLSPLPGNASNAEAKVTYSSDERDMARITTSMLNQLLRSLGHIVKKPLLQSSIESMIGLQKD
jgi:actin-related protein